MAPQRTVLPERNLDVLRAFAVTSVLADHLYMGFSGGALMWLAHWLGRAGVLAFFVHTSLVLMSSIERQGTNEAGWVGRFYIRRAFRIYPLAIAAILFVCLARISGEVPIAHTPGAFVTPRPGVLFANVFLLQNLSGAPNVIRVLWSLPIEVQMYAVLPLCYLIARSRWHWIGLAYAIGVAGAFIWKADVIPGLWRVDTLFFVPCFLCGVLAYRLLFRGTRPTFPAVTWLVFLPVLLLIAAGTLPHDIDRLQWETRPWMQWGYCLAIGLMIPVVAQLPDSLFTRPPKPWPSTATASTCSTRPRSGSPSLSLGTRQFWCKASSQAP